jgi:hypothetical protein
MEPKLSQVGTGLNSIKRISCNNENNKNVVGGNSDKIILIGQILDLYFSSTIPDNSNPYWYGDVFDNLYDKEIVELTSILMVYKITRNKPHV